MDRKEAIEVIKKNYPHVGISGSEFESALRELVPELKESEDERTRKYIITRVMEENISHYLRELIIAYLEKHKPYELTEEDRRIIPEALVMLCNDIINHRVHTPISTDEEGARKIKAFLKTFNRKPHKTKEEWEVQKEDERIRKYLIDVVNDYCKGSEREECIAYLEKQKEQKPLDVPSAGSGAQGTTRPSFVLDVKPAKWSEEDEWKRNELLKYLEEKGDYRSTWYSWLKDLPNCFSLQPKQEWSEEDEDSIEQAIIALEDIAADYEDNDKTCYAGHHVPFGEAAKRLKSLRHKPHWKPSEYTLSLVKKVANGEMLTHMEQMTMETLCNDLQKLL